MKRFIGVAEHRPSVVFKGCLGPSQFMKKESVVLNEALDAVLEFWKNGTAIHAESLVAKELIAAIENSRRPEEPLSIGD